MMSDCRLMLDCRPHCSTRVKDYGLGCDGPYCADPDGSGLADACQLSMIICMDPALQAARKYTHLDTCIDAAEAKADACFWMWIRQLETVNKAHHGHIKMIRMCLYRQQSGFVLARLCLLARTGDIEALAEV